LSSQFWLTISNFLRGELIMKKFAKISAVLAVLAALFFAFSFSGCSDGGSSNGDETVEDSSSRSSSSDDSSSGGSSSGSETGGSSGGSSTGSGSSSSGSESGSSGSGSSSGGGSGSGASSGSGSGSSSESENVSLKGTYWTRVDDEGSYYKYGSEYYYFTSDTAAESYKYDDKKSSYKLDSELTFSVEKNVLTVITLDGEKLGEGEFAGCSGSLTVYDSSIVEVFVADGETESKDFKKVDSKPTGKTTESK